MVQDANVGDFALIEFDTSPKKYYVGRITKPEDGEGDYEIAYMRRKRSTWEFHFPQVEDIASGNLNDIKMILPSPTQCGSTSRQKSCFMFAYDFKLLNVN